MFCTPTLKISCITCMQGDPNEEGVNNNNDNQVIPQPEFYGGSGGGPWDDGIYDGIRQISLAYGTCLDSICISYDKDGELVRGQRRGGLGRNSPHNLNKPLSTAEVQLDPDEFIVSVSGYYCGVTWVIGNPPVVRSLQFETNQRTFGPFGVQVGTPFTFKVNDGERIAGFKGRYGWYIDAIGFHVSNEVHLYGGRIRNYPWDDEVNDAIREITLVYGQCIDSMSVMYNRNGLLIIGERHGGINERGSDLHRPFTTVKIKLKYRNEYLVSVGGYYGELPWLNGGQVALRSLTFESNRKTYGPFGVETGTPFTFKVKDGDRIVGFKGIHGWYLNAIGFHTSPVPERGFFMKVGTGFWKAYEETIGKIIKPFTSAECTCISM